MGASLADTETSLTGRLDAHIQECMQLQEQTRAALVQQTATIQQTNNALVALKSSHDTIAADINAIKALPMRVIKYIGGIVVVAFVTVIVQNFVLHSDTSNKAARAEAAADRAASSAADTQTTVIRQLNAISSKP